LLGHGQVISIDCAPLGTIPHPRITYVLGSSVDPDIVSTVAGRARSIGAQKIFIMLDSDHTPGHVLQELSSYAPLVPVGSYIHVQDGCLDELPIYRRYAPGPLAAVKAFLRNNSSFIRDLEPERRYVMTAHPYGWLKRVKEG
jgi:cephalosporin hydroxylase